MWKLKYFFGGLLLLLAVPLTSCQKNEATIDQVPEIQNYMGVEIHYGSVEQKTGTVEQTIEAVYESVVAIDAYKDGTLYGSGSGVLFGKNDSLSFLVTCHHVIEGCSSFQILLTDGREFEANLVGTDEESDIAVLSIEATDLTYASWYEDTDQLKLGSGVICIGNPLGTLPGSVSTGIVSYNNRSIAVDNYHYRNLIQTDVAINSGNSGGGLFDYSGNLIGIVNAKYSSSGIEGLGFAIPSKEAIQIVDSILKTAIYSQETKDWIFGYVAGRWALDFELAYGGYGFYRTSIQVSSCAVNPTASDYNKLMVRDILSAITVHYQDENKMDQSLVNITASTTIESVYHFIYDSNLSIGDTLIFEVQRNGQLKTIEIPLIQYQYRI